MSKILSWFVALIVVFVLSACGGTGTGGNGTSGNGTGTGGAGTGSSGNGATSSCSTETGLDYLNCLRENTGLGDFSSETTLATAAQNHSRYMSNINTITHQEQSGNSDYTGEWPADRAVYAGYNNKAVTENASAGQTTTNKSIDSLMSAIYHRFGFLTSSSDLIGIGSKDNYYTYDMGNSQIKTLCDDPNAYSGSGYYYHDICKDSNKKIGKNKYDKAVADRAGSPDLILWPPDNALSIPPVFFDEIPDPLPNYHVSGYPVSVQFTKIYNENYCDHVSNVTILLKDTTSDSQVDKIKLMTKDNDQNHHFSKCQFAFFPKERLKWDTNYTATVTYQYDGDSRSKSWSFKTRSLHEEDSRVEAEIEILNNTDVHYNVTSGKWYAIYVVPKDGNDTLGGVSESYNTSEMKFDYIDQNTFIAKVTGSSGQYATFSFGNGQKVTLTIE